MSNDTRHRDSGSESGEDPQEPAEATRQLTESILRSVDHYFQKKSAVIDKKLERIVEKSSIEAKVQAKKLRDETPEFARFGNKDQFEHNVVVNEQLDTAIQHLKEAEVKEAIEVLEKGKRTIAERQKLIRLADQEPSGWAFVKEYKRSELASDSEDEKRQNRARAASNRKLSSRRPSKPYTGRWNSVQRSSAPSAIPSLIPSFNRQNAPRFSNFQPRPLMQQPPQDFRRNRFDRQCFAWGNRGHLIYNCPNIPATTNAASGVRPNPYS